MKEARRTEGRRDKSSSRARNIIDDGAGDEKKFSLYISHPFEIENSQSNVWPSSSPSSLILLYLMDGEEEKKAESSLNLVREAGLL